MTNSSAQFKWGSRAKTVELLKMVSCVNNTRWCIMCKLFWRGVVDILEDKTPASKVQFSTMKEIFFKILASSRSIRYIITKIYVIAATTVSNVWLEKRLTNIIFLFT